MQIWRTLGNDGGGGESIVEQKIDENKTLLEILGLLLKEAEVASFYISDV